MQKPITDNFESTTAASEPVDRLTWLASNMWTHYNTVVDITVQFTTTKLLSNATYKKLK